MRMVARIDGDETGIGQLSGPLICRSACVAAWACGHDRAAHVVSLMPRDTWLRDRHEPHTAAQRVLCAGRCEGSGATLGPDPGLVRAEWVGGAASAASAARSD